MFHEQDVVAGKEFSMTLSATTTGVAAGNIVAASAAAATQFALSNPVGSGILLVLSKLIVGVISGTPPGGSLFHGLIANVPTLAFSGTTVPLRAGGANSAAKGYTSAAGAALTGGLAPTIWRASSIALIAGAVTSPGITQGIEDIQGDLVIPEGYTWVPLWSAAGTSMLNSYTITWKERAK